MDKLTSHPKTGKNIVASSNTKLNEASYNFQNALAASVNPSNPTSAISDAINKVPEEYKNAKFGLAFHPSFATSSELKNSTLFDKKGKTENKDKIREWIGKLLKGDGKESEQVYGELIDFSTRQPKGELKQMIDTFDKAPSAKARKDIYNMAAMNIAYLLAKNPDISDKAKQRILNFFPKGKAEGDNIRRLIKDADEGTTDDSVEVATETSAMELSVNDLIGRLHDTAMTAVTKEFGGLGASLKRFAKNLISLGFASGDAAIFNSGIIQDGDKSVFAGGDATYQIFVIPSGLLGRKSVAQKAMKLYLKYFAGEDIDVNLDAISKAQPGVLGGKTNVWAYPYKITYKRFSRKNLSEAKFVGFPKTKSNVWINENINPFNHKESIRPPKFDDFVEAVRTGKNVKAKQILEKNLKSMLKNKIKATSVEK